MLGSATAYSSLAAPADGTTFTLFSATPSTTVPLARSTVTAWRPWLSRNATLTMSEAALTTTPPLRSIRLPARICACMAPLRAFSISICNDAILLSTTAWTSSVLIVGWHLVQMSLLA